MITKTAKEKVLIAVVDFTHSKNGWPLDEIKNELKELVLACDGEVADTMECRVDKPNAANLIGKGKIEEIAQLCDYHKVDTLVFSHDLKGSQQRNIEDIVNVKTIDRTQLILDIFARRAQSQEGKMQVELAQLEYLLPRLVGKGVELSRLGGGIGTLGPGETKLEVDRRRIGQRIAKLKRELKDVSDNRALKRKKRKDKGIPAISLVGYTNAGKSTLLNRLTESKQRTKDGLFTTLDSLSRQYILPNHQKVIISDTVGFLHDLPHHLVESFKATLEEVNEADLLIHVVDVSFVNFRNLIQAVLDVLNELEVHDVPTILVFNKIDCIDKQEWLNDLTGSFGDSVCISAKTGQGIDELNHLIEAKLADLIVEVDILLPINRMDLINLAHEEGQVFSVKYYNDRINLRASLPNKIAGKIISASI